MGENKSCGTGGCGCSSTVEQKSSGVAGAEIEKKRRIEMDFLFLDLEVCSPCRTTETNIEEALSEVAGILRATSVEVSVNKTHAKAMIIEAVLQEVYGSTYSEPAKIVRPENALENLARFFESKSRQNLTGVTESLRSKADPPCGSARQ